MLEDYFRFTKKIKEMQFKRYKARRVRENRAFKTYLKGKVVWPSKFIEKRQDGKIFVHGKGTYERGRKSGARKTN